MKNLVAAAMTAAICAAGSAHAGSVEIDIIQLNGNVSIGYGGTFDTPDVPPVSLPPEGGISPSDGLIVSADGMTILDFYLGAGFFAPFGDGAALLGGAVSGDGFAIGPTVVGLRNGYVSGSEFSGSLSFENTSLSELGIDLISNRTFEVGLNTFVLNSSISSDVNAVPLPPALALMLSALVGLGAMSRKRAV